MDLDRRANCLRRLCGWDWAKLIDWRNCLSTRCSTEAPQRDELRGGLRGSCEGGLGVKVQRQCGANCLHAAVPLERRDSSKWRPRLSMDNRCHGNYTHQPLLTFYPSSLFDLLEAWDIENVQWLFTVFFFCGEILYHPVNAALSMLLGGISCGTVLLMSGG